MQKFPKIRQFNDAVQTVRTQAHYAGKDDDGQPIYDGNRVSPTLQYHGTVKLHGTNASVVLQPGRNPIYQSRNRVITADDDNAGFATAMTEDYAQPLIDLYTMLRYKYGFAFGDQVVVYGEWCGRGIQKGCAIHELPRMFVVFAVLHDDSWLDIEKLPTLTPGLKMINSFEQFDITIDFNADCQPGTDIHSQLVDLTLAVEAECPVGKAHYVSGIGEGIVWRCVTPGYTSSEFWFKTKGEKHSATKVKTKTLGDKEDKLKYELVKEFVTSTVTDYRLVQGMQYLTEMNHTHDRTSTGIFLKWVCNDILDEEDALLRSRGLKKKDVTKAICSVAKTWFFGVLAGGPSMAFDAYHNAG